MRDATTHDASASGQALQSPKFWLLSDIFPLCSLQLGRR